VRITILYDNQAERRLRRGWGFSCLVESDINVLFDTGDSGSNLIYNFEKMQIDFRSIDVVFLSHKHWDHTGGLKAFKKVNSSAKLIGPDEFAEITSLSSEVFTTGGMGKMPKEQSMVVGTERGNIVITGCAHPGLGQILKSVRELGDIYGVLGGFHGFSDFDELSGVELIGPCHCTRYRDEIREKFPGCYREMYAGSIIEV
jgi:7,8-dihydropterin-6-yl-methyl-4-(beta-D-ribofuranosyl)aminobenzene 5'-phosphate synthase